MSTKFVPPFLLIRKDGQTYLYDDLETLACAMRGAINGIHEYHVLCYRIDIHNRQVYDHAGNPVQEIAEWIVRDDHGQIVKQGDVRDALPVSNWRRSGRYGRMNAQKERAIALGIPVPRTGRRTYGNYFRLPKDMGARSAKACDYEKTFEDVVPKGKIKIPPSSWDDVMRADYGRRSWKHYRKHQWKE